MKLAGLIDELGLQAYVGRKELARAVSGGYVGDLLSDVMAHARPGNLWVTIQAHPNIVAVAVFKQLAAVVLVNGREPAPETVQQAEKEGVPILGTPLSAFELVGKLTELGLKGK